MSHENIIRTWKDEEYRMRLREEDRPQIPENPVGLIELTDSELELVGGGYDAYLSEVVEEIRTGCQCETSGVYTCVVTLRRTDESGNVIEQNLGRVPVVDLP